LNFLPIYSRCSNVQPLTWIQSWHQSRIYPVCQVSAWRLLLPQQYGTIKPSSLLTAMSKSKVFM
jgi:hypothetical protein